MENRAAFSDTDVTGKSHTLLVGCSENCRQTRDSRVVCRVERKVTIRDKLVHGELKRQQPFEGRTRIQPAKTSWPGRSSGFLDMSIVTSRENILNQESHGQVFGRPIQYPRDRLDSKEENRSTGIFIAASHDLGVPCNLVPSPVGKEVGACIVCCVLIVAFDRGRSFIDLKFDFSFFASPSQCPDETENRNQRHGAGLCVYGVTQVAASRSAVCCEIESQNEFKRKRPAKEDNSRVYIIEATKVLQHAIAEVYIVTWFASKKTILLCLQRRLALTHLPSRIPMMPGLGGGDREAVR
jgi:hypothetical protein